MKTRPVQNILVIILCSVVIISVSVLDFLPWWIFLVPVLILGYGLSLLKLKVNGFELGFISGFLIWFGGNLLFDLQYNGFTLFKLAKLVNAPKVLLLIASGMIGGLLTGLALYVGKNIFKDAEPPNPEPSDLEPSGLESVSQARHAMHKRK